MPVSQECVETRTKESTRLDPTGMGGELWIACEGTGVSTGGRAHSSIFFCSAGQGVQHVCVRGVTDRDFERVSAVKKVTVWICATDNRP